MATPTLALIPTGYKAGKLYSVLPESGVGDFTVVRATEATRVNEAGLIETMGANVPRLDYSGGGCPVLLTEGQSTNLITYSEDFSDAYWTKAGSSVVSGFTSPDGASNAFKLVEDTSTGVHKVYSGFLSVTNGTTYTLSFFIKKGETNFAQILFGSTGFGNTHANFDLNLGEVGDLSGINASSTITAFSNDWYKCTITADSNLTTSSALGIVLPISSKTSARQETYTGDGTSGLYIWGAQFEQGSYSTSYIPTSGSAVTRNGDQVTGAGDAATFNDSEGVLMAEIEGTEDGTNRYISISDGSIQNRITIIFLSNNIVGQIRASNSEVFYQSTSGISIEQNNKIAVHYKTNQCKLFVNGFQIGSTDILAPMPSGLNTLAFDRGDGANNFYGKTSQIQYFNTVLTDSELETLTSWTSFIEMAQAQNYNII